MVVSIIDHDWPNLEWNEMFSELVITIVKDLLNGMYSKVQACNMKDNFYVNVNCLIFCNY